MSDLAATASGEAPAIEPCRVYWGSHGCDLPRGHDFPLHICGFTDQGGAHAFHDGGNRAWLAEYTTAGEDDPPTGMSDALAGSELFGEDAR